MTTTRAAAPLARLFAWLDDLRHDARHAVRSSAQNPAFSIAAILTLSIGIGLTTAIVSIVDAVLVRPLPFPDDDRLVTVLEPEISRTAPRVNYVEYLEWRSRTTMLDGLAAHTFNPQVMVPTREGTARLSAGMISSSYFDVLGARPALGRLIDARDEANPDVVVLSQSAWRTYFRAEPGAVGAAMELRGTLTGPSGAADAPGRLLTIIGVLPEDLPRPVPRSTSYSRRRSRISSARRLTPESTAASVSRCVAPRSRPRRA